MDKRKDAKKMENNNMSNGMQQNGAAMNGPPIGYQAPPAPRTSTGKTILVIAAVIVIYFIMQIGASFITGAMKLEPTSYPAQLVNSLFSLAGHLIVLLAIMKKKGVLTSKGNGIVVGLVAGGYLIVAGAMNGVNALFMTTNKDGVPTYAMPKGLVFGSNQIWCILAVLVSAGICEELMFRGIILNALRDRFGRDTFKGTLLAIIISGVMFGCMHFINLTAGVPFLSVLAQVVNVTGMGLFMGAVYCRCGNIKACMLLHFFLDICILLPNSMKSAGADLSSALTETISPAAFIGILVYGGITAFLLRKGVRHELFSYSLDENKAA